MCALTQYCLGVSLWRHRENPLINYPVAENTDAYFKAHLELYRLLIDGIDTKAIDKLAEKRGIQLTDRSQTLGNLKRVLPEDVASAVWPPLDYCRRMRNENHGGLDKPAEPFRAFDSFHVDLANLAAGLTVLRKWLEVEFDADAEACLHREQVLRMFPKLSGPPRPEFKLGELERAVGKTISHVKFGEEHFREGVHRSEAMVFHFTDGTAMAILVGSNAKNLAHKFPGLKAEQISVDLMVFWAPSGRRKTG